MIQIGRVQLVEHDPVVRVGDDGTSLSISGHTGALDRGRAEWTRQQLLGYVNSPDESFIPFTWDAQPELNGFFRVTGASVDGARALAHRGLWDFSVDLERVTGFAAPLVELRSLGTVRANTHGLSTATQATCVPESSRSVGFLDELTGVYIPFAPDLTREGARGSVLVYKQLVLPYTTQFYVAPENHYDGAPALLMGDDLAVVVGRQVSNTPGAWRLTNGLFEIEPGPDPDEFQLRARMWLGGAYTDWVDLTVLYGANPAARLPLAAPHAVTVLRNGPEEVGIRLLTSTTTSAGLAYSPVYLDISLKRGSRWAGFELRSDFTGYYGLRAPVFAGATLASSIYWWKTVASPMRMVVAGPQDIGQSGNDLFPNEVGDMFVTEWSFLVGLVDGADAGDNVNHCVNEYMYAGSQKQAVVVQ